MEFDRDGLQSGRRGGREPQRGTQNAGNATPGFPWQVPAAGGVPSVWLIGSRCIRGALSAVWAAFARLDPVRRNCDLDR